MHITDVLLRCLNLADLLQVLRNRVTRSGHHRLDHVHTVPVEYVGATRVVTHQVRVPVLRVVNLTVGIRISLALEAHAVLSIILHLSVQHTTKLKKYSK